MDQHAGALLPAQYVCLLAVLFGQRPGWRIQAHHLTAGPFGLGLFAYLIRRLSGSNALGVSALVLPPPTIQFSGSSTRATASGGGVTYEPSPSSNMFFVRCKAFWSANGYALCGRIRRVVVRPGQPTSIDLEPVFLYMTDALRPVGQPEDNPLSRKGLSSASPQALRLSPTAFTTVSSGSGWTLYRTLPGQTITVTK